MRRPTELHTSNGIPITVVHRPGLSAVTVVLRVGGGSRHEAPDEVGGTHLLEHLVLQDRDDRTSYSRLADSLGGESNALTTKHETYFFSTVPPGAFEPVATRLLEDITRPVITDDKVDREKAIVEAELRSAAVDPSDYIYERWATEALGTDPFARPTGGTVASLAALTPELLRRLHGQRLASQNLHLLVSGDVTPDQVLALVEVGPLSSVPRTSWQPTVKMLDTAADYDAHGDDDGSGIAVIMVGGPCPGADDATGVAAATVLNALLGGSSASLIFQRIRGDLGLAYECSSFYYPYPDLGLWRATMEVDKGSVTRALDELAQLLKQLRRSLSPTELERSRTEAQGRHLVGRDQSFEHLTWVGDALRAGRSGDVDADFTARLGEVDRDDVLDVVDGLTADGLVYAVTGDVGGSGTSGRIDLA